MDGMMGFCYNAHMNYYPFVILREIMAYTKNAFFFPLALFYIWMTLLVGMLARILLPNTGTAITTKLLDIFGNIHFASVDTIRWYGIGVTVFYLVSLASRKVWPDRKKIGKRKQLILHMLCIAILVMTCSVLTLFIPSSHVDSSQISLYMIYFGFGITMIIMAMVGLFFSFLQEKVENIRIQAKKP